MKLYLAAILLLLLWDDVLGLAGKGRSDDLSRALGVVRRRRRWLESGIHEGNHHSRPHHMSQAAYGTVTHFPDVRKRPYLDPETAASLVPPPPPPPAGPIFRERVQEKWKDSAEDSSDEDKKKMKRIALKKKRSLFRERQHSIEEEERKKRAMILKKRAKKNGMSTWDTDTERELQRLAERRFLEEILNSYKNAEPEEDAHFDTSEEVFGDLTESDVRALLAELESRVAHKYAQEDDGPEDSQREPLNVDDDEDEEDLRKRGAVWKRYLWQDGLRYSLGDHPTKKKNDESWDEPYDLPMMLHRKQPMWSPDDAEDNSEDDGEEGNGDLQISPRELARFRNLLEMLQRGDDDEDSVEWMKRKREPDPWYPAFDIKRYVQSPWNNYLTHSAGREDQMDRKRRFLPIKRKRTAFRERITHDPGVTQFVGAARKRLAPLKRSTDNEEKRVVKKSVTAEAPKKVVDGVAMKELQSILADDPKEVEKKNVAKREGKSRENPTTNSSQTVSPSHDHSLHPNSIGEEGEKEDNEVSDEAFSDETIDDYFGYDKRDVSRKRKRQSWDDYLGIDKRLSRRAHFHPNHHLIEPHPEKEATKAATGKTEAADPANPTKASQDAPASVTQATVETLPSSVANESVASEGNLSANPEHQKFSEWVMNRYFKSMASAMSSKRKRTPSIDFEEATEDGGSGAHPLAAMDRKLEAIEDLMLEEALDLVEDGGAGDGEDQRERIMHRLDAAHSLEKMREALAQFEGSLDKIRSDEKHPTLKDEDQWEEEDKKKKKMKKMDIDKEEEDEEEKKKKKSLDKKQSSKRPSEDHDSVEEELDVDGAVCPVFDEIVGLCDELSKTYGDEQRTLIDACSRHIMCYACDYVYNERDSLPCSLIFMREAHDICKDVYCRSAAGQIHGALRQRAPQIQRATAPMCLSNACVRAYRRR